MVARLRKGRTLFFWGGEGCCRDHLIFSDKKIEKHQKDQEVRFFGNLLFHHVFHFSLRLIRRVT